MAPNVTLRPFDVELDAERCAELLTQNRPEPITAGQIGERERRRSPDTVILSLTAVTPDGNQVAFAEVRRKPWEPSGQFHLEGIVDPVHRNHGIGTLLFDELKTFALDRGATRLTADVRDHHADALRFIQNRGFRIDRHVFESTLDLATFDDTPFADAITRAEAAGIVFRSLADYGDSEPARRKACALNNACIRDIPGHEGADRPWEEYKKIYEMSWYRPDGQVLAVDPSGGEDRFVALAAIGYFPETNSVYHMHTGVDREYRGRGLALATKLMALRRAREWGAAYARTNNDSKNAPILAVNRKLGYVPKPGYYKLVAPLSS